MRRASAVAGPVLAGLALAPLAACGGSVDAGQRYAAGVEQLGHGDRAGATADLEAARDAVGDDRTHPDYWGIRLALAEAHAVDRPQESELLVLQAGAERPGGLAAREYAYVGGKLNDAGHPLQALAVVHAGLQVYPDDAQLESLLPLFVERAESDPVLAKQLEGLGYINLSRR